MNQDLGALSAARKTGEEQFTIEGAPTGASLLDFWRWSNSDLVDNTARGVVAEYVVARALGISTAGVREAWAACDLESVGGLKIQVKSAAYVQSWTQERLSRIEFPVPKRRAWDPRTGLEREASRHSHIYVFALLAHREKRTLDPLELTQWRFYALPTSVLDARDRSQHSITLRSLEALAGLCVGFQGLRDVVEGLARERGLPPIE